jgi:hypothetical protein
MVWRFKGGALQELSVIPGRQANPELIFQTFGHPLGPNVAPRQRQRL